MGNGVRGPGNRRPVRALETLTRGEMQADALKARKDLKRMNPGKGYALGVARVVNLDYEEFYATLRIEIGEGDQFVRAPVPLTFPGAGKRHFFGAMPQVGDYCIVGWMPQETGRDKTKTPVILSWIIPGVWPGREWVTTAGFPLDELDSGLGPESDIVKGVYDRIRHKLRHVQPGNIVGSSAQGADLVLDESVTLANRRGNEIRLRDQDQAFIVRSLQQFHATAGARVYTGMVQRDAQLLATTMVSDGSVWDGQTQSVNGEPLSESELPTDLANPEGFLTPARPLSRGRMTEGDDNLDRSLLPVSDNLDPYEFLRRGGFINDAGFVVGRDWAKGATYGGKTIYRVASQGTNNAAVGTDTETLTEHRVEITHTSDGRLPVTEQTDGFDAERLPDEDPVNIGHNGLPANVPYIEFVLGSVVGNDPFTQQGRTKYGMPLVTSVFDGDEVNPRIEAATIVDEQSSVEASTPLREHAATLMRVSPLDGLPDTFWSVNKGGQMRAFLSGPQDEPSLEAALAGGLRLSVGGVLELMLNGGIHIGTQSEKSVHLESSRGPVRITGGGPIGGAAAVGERASGSGKGESGLPHVDIEAPVGNAQIKAAKKVTVKGESTEVNATVTMLKGHEKLGLRTNNLETSAKSANHIVNGKAQETFGGPKDQLPTNGALHERSYSPNMPGITCEEILYSLGDRNTQFRQGNDSSEILIGDRSYVCQLGKYTAQGTTSKLEMDSTGFVGEAQVGSMTLRATAGQASMTGTSGATMEASGGMANVRSSSMVQLSAPASGPDIGGVLCSGSLEPFTNLPYSTWGIGSKTVLVTA